MATFNVRTAKATTDVRPWLTRRGDVAELIYARHPDVVAIQELGPGRADGKAGSTTGTMRQTTSLLDSLGKIDADNYKLVRTTPYVKAGTTHGSQGTRILFDSNKLTLVSDCPEVTGKSEVLSFVLGRAPDPRRRVRVQPPQRRVRQVRRQGHQAAVLRGLGPPRRPAQHDEVRRRPSTTTSAAPGQHRPEGHRQDQHQQPAGDASAATSTRGRTSPSVMLRTTR